jgi:SNF2 family DNA or RNA helicase
MVHVVRDRAQAAGWAIRPGLTIVADSVLGHLRINRCDLLVLDESHRFKSIDAERSKVALGRHGMAGHAQRVLALSGTPAPNGPHELFTLLARIAPSIAPTWEAFRDRFCPTYDKFVGTRKVVAFTATNTQELNRLLRETVLHRPKREDILAHLPPMRRDDFVVECNVSGVSMEQALSAFDADDPEERDAPHFAEARRILGEAKAAAAGEYLALLCDGGDRPLIWCWHQSAADALGRSLRVPVIHGGVDMTKRRAFVAEFVAGRHDALVLTIAAAGTGLDGLQHATDCAVFVERAYVPADNEQAEGRIHRTGQTSPVRIINIHATDPMDRALDQTLRRKAQVFNEVHQ